MKNIVKRFWPLLTVGLLAIGILTGVLLYHSRRTPQRAVEGYIRASLQYDADGMIQYASEYQLTELKGSEPSMDLETLRRSLKNSYEQADAYRVTGKITFESAVGTVLEPGMKKFDELLELYAYKADPSEVSAFALVTGSCYVDGVLTMKYSRYAVKSNGKWYYGFIAE